MTLFIINFKCLISYNIQEQACNGKNKLGHGSRYKVETPVETVFFRKKKRHFPSTGVMLAHAKFPSLLRPRTQLF